MLSNGPSMLRWRPHGNHACMNRHVNRMRRACEALRCRELDGRWMQQLACMQKTTATEMRACACGSHVCVRCLPLCLTSTCCGVYRCVTTHQTEFHIHGASKPRRFTSMELYTLEAAHTWSFTDLEFTYLEFHRL